MDLSKETIGYLRNGQKVMIFEELSDGRFVVEEIYQYYFGNEHDEWLDEQPSGRQIIVDFVTDKEPAALYAESITREKHKLQELKQQTTDLEREKLQLKVAIEKLKRDAQDSDKWIIDLKALQKAKRVSYFLDREVAYRDFQTGISWGLKLHMEIILGRRGEDRSWATQMIGSDNEWGSSNYVKAGEGYFLDMTDDQLMAMAKARVKQKGLGHFYLQEHHRQYIPDEMLEEFDQIIADRKELEIGKIERQIEANQKELERLRMKLEGKSDLEVPK